jgi:hypothetical protein
MNIIKLSIHFDHIFKKKELPSERILMATLGDDGDIKNIYMYTMILFQKSQSFFTFFANIRLHLYLLENLRWYFELL